MPRKNAFVAVLQLTSPMGRKATMSPSLIALPVTVIDWAVRVSRMNGVRIMSGGGYGRGGAGGGGNGGGGGDCC